MTLVSKNVSIEKLYDIVNKYNNGYHNTSKIKSIDLKKSTCINFDEKKKPKKILNLKLVTMEKYKNINILQKVTFQISLKKVLLLQRLKVLFCGHWSEWWRNCCDILPKKLQKANQKEFMVEKVIKRKSDKLCVKWKDYNNSFNSWINKKDIVL